MPVDLAALLRQMFEGEQRQLDRPRHTSLGCFPRDDCLPGSLTKLPSYLEASQRLRVVAVAAMSGSIPVHANLVEQVEYTGRIGSGNKLPVFGKFFPPGGDQTRA
jgi:hypothetical protein